MPFASLPFWVWTMIAEIKQYGVFFQFGPFLLLFQDAQAFRAHPSGGDRS